MQRKIKAKIYELRQQPDDVRLRAAALFTAIAGVLIGGIWLAGLLPAQLWVAHRGTSTETAQTQSTGQVSGARSQLPGLVESPPVQDTAVNAGNEGSQQKTQPEQK